MISTKLYLGIATFGILIVQIISLPQGVSFDGETNADDTQTRLGLVASVLGNHPTGEDVNSNSQENANERQVRSENCCCVRASSFCPNDRNIGGNGGNFGGSSNIFGAGGGSPRLKGTSDSQQPDTDGGGIAVRIVNDQTEFSQPQVQQEHYCEANEKSCCYDSSSTLNNVIRNSRCITRRRPANKNVFWEQKCQETEPRGIRRGEKRCGERRFREISGKNKGEANPGEFPWTCLVLNQNNDFIGSCAIIPDNRFNDVRGGTDRVITAAHKLKKIQKNDEVKIRVIEYDASGFKGPENTRHKEYVVDEIITHPSYDSVRLSYDMAVLKVKTRPDGFGGVKGRIELTSTDDINAACLPGCSNMFGHQFANGTGVRCWVAGWGKDSSTGNFQIVQNRVDVPLMGRNQCQQRMIQALGRNAGRSFRLSPSEICAGGEEGKDACDGDGGAPLVCQSRDNRWHVVGLVTWGVDCARKGVPGIYANIYNMLDFIMTA